MCTVSYVPKGKNEFILTSNRDEHASRSPQRINSELSGRNQLIFPRDTEAGGTWIAVSDSNQLVCVLNGAFERHHRNPPYRRSRGLMVLDFFSFKSANDFFRNYRFEGMESFTLVVFDNGQLFELRWDEKKKYLKALDPAKAHFWSSATLYTKSARKRRAGWFWDWYSEQSNIDLNSMLEFHKNGGEADLFNGYVMNRHGIVQTVSITAIEKKADSFQMQYYDLLRDAIKFEEIELSAPVPLRS